MSDEAENNGSAPNATPAAGEHQVPKYRFDEVNERLREAERRLSMKDELLNRLAPQPAQPRNEEVNFEEMGIDPTVGRALLQMVNKVTDSKMAPIQQRAQGLIGMAAQRADEALFIAKHGSDKAKDMDRIQEYRKHHYNTTGQALDVETAYKLFVFDQLTNKTQAVRNQPAQPANSQTPPAVAQAAPPAGGNPPVNQAPPGGAAASGKGFDEMTIEEQEDYLNQQMGQGAQF